MGCDSVQRETGYGVSDARRGARGVERVPRRVGWGVGLGFPGDSLVLRDLEKSAGSGRRGGGDGGVFWDFNNCWRESRDNFQYSVLLYPFFLSATVVDKG